LKKRKKRRFKKRYLLLADLVAVIIILLLLLYKPAHYDPPKPIGAANKEVSPYLTHVILPQLYNESQLGEPFYLTITQEGINDIIARSKWPRESNGVTLSAPVVHFVPDNVVLMGTASVKGVELVVTIVLKPALDQAGLLNLRVAKVKIGAMNLTPLAKLIAKRMYRKQIATAPIDKEDIGAQIAASLLNNEPFVPIIRSTIENEDIKVRIEKVTISQEKLTLRLVPTL